MRGACGTRPSRRRTEGGAVDVSMLVVALLTFIVTTVGAVAQLWVVVAHPGLDVLAKPTIRWSVAGFELPASCRPSFLSLLNYEVETPPNAESFSRCAWGIRIPASMLARDVGHDTGGMLCAARVDPGSREEACYASQHPVEADDTLIPESQAGWALPLRPQPGEIVVGCQTLPRDSLIKGRLWYPGRVRAADVAVRGFSEDCARWPTESLEPDQPGKERAAVVSRLLAMSLLSGLCLLVSVWVVARAAP